MNWASIPAERPITGSLPENRRYEKTCLTKALTITSNIFKNKSWKDPVPGLYVGESAYYLHNNPIVKQH
jgi:hypothetical protein